MSICGEICDQQSLNISVTPLFVNCEEYSGILTLWKRHFTPFHVIYLFIYSFIYLQIQYNKQVGYSDVLYVLIGHYLSYLRVYPPAIYNLQATEQNFHGLVCRSQINTVLLPQFSELIQCSVTLRVGNVGIPLYNKCNLLSNSQKNCLMNSQLQVPLQKKFF